MRLLITGDTEGGVFTFVSDLAEGLRLCGVEVTLATFGPEAAEVSHPGVQHFHFASKLEWQDDPWDDIEAAGRWLSDLVSREQPDILHLNTLCHGNLSWDIPIMLTVHSCVLSWWSAVMQTSVPKEWNRYRQVVWSSLRSASPLVFPSRALMNACQRVWPLCNSTLHVVHNGRNPNLFSPGIKEKLILSAGRFWDRAKNVAALEEVAPKIAWPIILAGEFRQPSRCRPVGYLSQRELSDWYSRASIYVSPASYEPFGLAALEAAMAGCALVLSDIPSFREIWGDAAVFCAPGTLQEKLQELIADPKLLAKWQQRALMRSRRYTQSRMAAKYLSLYQQATGLQCAS